MDPVPWCGAVYEGLSLRCLALVAVTSLHLTVAWMAVVACHALMVIERGVVYLWLVSFDLKVWLNVRSY